MRGFITITAIILALSFVAIPAFADDMESDNSEECSKTIIIKTTGEDGLLEISGDEECKIIVECEGIEDLVDLEDGEKKIKICIKGDESIDLGDLDIDLDIEGLEVSSEDGKTVKKIIISPDGECPDMSELDVDIEDIEGKCTIRVKDTGDEVVITAKGDKDALQKEIDSLINEFTEDGGKVKMKETDDGFEITIEK